MIDHPVYIQRGAVNLKTLFYNCLKKCILYKNSIGINIVLKLNPIESNQTKMR